MIFAHPWAFLLLLPLAAAGWLVLSDSGRRAPRLPVPALPGFWRREPGAAARAARVGPHAAKLAVLACLLAALAGPQTRKSRAPGSGQGIDILLDIDTSLSMSALDFSPENRLQAAVQTALRFVEGRTSDRIGVVNFGGVPQLSCPLTTDYQAVDQALRGLSPGDTGTDGTAIGDAIVSGINHLSGAPGKSKVLILLTDGRSNTGAIDPMTATKLAAQYGIKVYTIGCAKKGQSFMPVDDPIRGRMMVPIADDLDDSLLAQIAQDTGGLYFRATSLQNLRQIYATIDSLEKTEVKLPPVWMRRDVYFYPAGLAALLLLLAAAARATAWLVFP